MWVLLHRWNMHPNHPEGLSSEGAKSRLARCGQNAILEEERHPLSLFLDKLWGPLPWMLESLIVLLLVFGKSIEASAALMLLLFNAAVGFFQESRARSILTLLKSNVKATARAMRDGKWILLDTSEIVPGDLIRVRRGDFAPADIVVAEGSVQVDRSAVSLEVNPGERILSGSMIRKGEATGVVEATSQRSSTAELAEPGSHLEKLVVTIVAYLVALVVALVAAVGIYASFSNISLEEILPFVFVLLIASIPFALPAIFTWMSARAAQNLAEKGIQVTRLTALEDIAAMDVFCCDKTGTMTLNRLELVGLEPSAPFTQKELLGYAALASQQASQDPIDVAILALAQQEGVLPIKERMKFLPFDPSTKLSEAFVNNQHIVKGAPSVVAGWVGKEILEKAESLSEGGYRVLCVAVEEEGRFQFAGYLLFSDPVRPVTKGVISDLTSMGITVKLVTGDTPATAESVATEVGIGPRMCRREEILTAPLREYEIFPEVFPEDKFHLVEMWQKLGCVVGMTGDSVNDAPALRQSDIGVAVANATDVAKAAAGLVLTKPGISSLVDAILSGREVFGRMRTCILNKIAKSTHIALFLSLGFLFFKVFLTTPLLIMLLIFANDFVTLSLASDRAAISQKPCLWNSRFLALSAFGIGLCWVLFSFGVFAVSRDYFSLSELQTLVFLLLVFSGLATVYLVRTQHFFWQVSPGKGLLISTFAVLVVVCLMAHYGILMVPLNALSILLLGLSVLAFLALLDLVKVVSFKISNWN